MFVRSVAYASSLCRERIFQDLEKGKLAKVDAINGAVSEYGRKVGLSNAYERPCC